MNTHQISKPLQRSLALLLAAMVAACGSDGGKDSIFGNASGTVVAGIVPGATCSAAAGPTIPTVTASDPSNGNQSATTSTNGVAANGKLITATFSLPMNSATISSTSFTLAPTGGAALTPASVTYSNQLATLTTSSALAPNTSYTANITQAVTSASGTPIGCRYVWNFRTAPVAGSGAAPVNLGRAAPFAIAATAGVTNTGTMPNTLINGDTVLDPNTTCNSVAIDASGGFGLCGGFPPTINGTVISPLFPADAGATSGGIYNDLRAAFLSITPPAGPPAAGSLGGATNIPAGTTLGEPTGSALVQGDNLFAPGVYQSTTSILITGDLTLDGQGDTNASFIFQSSSTVDTAAGAASPGAHTRILLINGARASNVWWQAGSSATLGTNTEFQGNILASASVTLNTGASSCGRLLAGGFTAGAFVFDSNIVSVPGHSSAPSSCQ